MLIGEKRFVEERELEDVLPGEIFIKKYLDDYNNERYTCYLKTAETPEKVLNRYYYKAVTLEMGFIESIDGFCKVLVVPNAKITIDV